MTLLAHVAAKEARHKSITKLQPVVDDLFRQLVTTSVYNRGPLHANSLDLYPSAKAIVQIEYRLREITQRTQAANRGLLTQGAAVVTSQP
jgi:hypothetical protein